MSITLTHTDTEGTMAGGTSKGDGTAAERRIAAVLEAVEVGREHGCTTFDLTNLTRMLTEDEPPG